MRNHLQETKQNEVESERLQRLSGNVLRCQKGTDLPEVADLRQNGMITQDQKSGDDRWKWSWRAATHRISMFYNMLRVL